VIETYILTLPILPSVDSNAGRVFKSKIGDSSVIKLLFYGADEGEIVVRFTTKTKGIHSLHRDWTGCGANVLQVQYIPWNLTFR